MYHLSSIPLVSLTGNTRPPFREGLPMASRHGAIIWAGRSGPRLRYGILNNDHIAELLATRCC